MSVTLLYNIDWFDSHEIWKCFRDGCIFIIGYVSWGRGSLSWDSGRIAQDKGICPPEQCKDRFVTEQLCKTVQYSVYVQGKKQHVDLLITILSNVRETS